jgi:addiction module RelE/StbE family toxin
MVRRDVFWSEDEQRDLAAIVDHIADDSPLDALRVFDRLAAQAHKLEIFAERGRRVPELGARGKRSPFRELVVRPWRLIYAVQDDHVMVLAVVDSRRDFLAWLSNRGGLTRA